MNSQLRQLLARFSHLPSSLLMGGLIVSLLLMVLFIRACSQAGYDDLQEYIQSVRSRLPGKLEPVPKFESYQGVIYSASNLRSPFQKSIKTIAPGTGPDVNRPKEPLEAFPLDSLRMVGTLMRGKTLWALIMIREGTVYPITIGNYLGQNFGRVVNISRDKIEIQETILEGDEWVGRIVVLVLTEQSSKEKTAR